MRLPSKVINYKKSIISKFPLILSAVIKRPTTVSYLYRSLKEFFFNISEFTETLVCLYALNKINITSEGVIEYVKIS